MINLKFWQRNKGPESYWKKISILSIIAVLVSAYLLKLELAVKADSNFFCDLSDKFSCTTVALSKYSELFGIPIAAYGIVAYSLMLLMSIYFTNSKKINQKVWGSWLAFIGGCLLFSLYLTYLELFVIKSICIFCVIQQIVILLIVICHWPIIKTDTRL